MPNPDKFNKRAALRKPHRDRLQRVPNEAPTGQENDTTGQENDTNGQEFFRRQDVAEQQRNTDMQVQNEPEEHQVFRRHSDPEKGPTIHTPNPDYQFISSDDSPKKEARHQSFDEQNQENEVFNKAAFEGRLNKNQDVMNRLLMVNPNEETLSYGHPFLTSEDTPEPETGDEDEVETTETDKIKTEFLEMTRVSDAIRHPMRKKRLVAIGGGPAAFPLQKYSKPLYEAIFPLWILLGILCKLPFKVKRTGNTAEIKITRRNPLFWLTNLFVVFHVFLWAWISKNLWDIYTWSPPNELKDKIRRSNCGPEAQFYNMRMLEQMIASRFIMDAFFMWCSITHTALFSINLMMKCFDITAFVREWFRLADFCKLYVHKGIFAFIIRQAIYIVFWTIIHILLYKATVYKNIFGASTVMTMAMIRPFYTKPEHAKAWCIGAEPFYHHYSYVGLLINLYFIINSRILLVFYFVLQRIYGNCFNNWNKRLEMALGKREADEDSGGRLPWRVIQADFSTLQTTGKILNPMFRYCTVPWFTLQIFSILFEVFVLTYFFYTRMIFRLRQTSDFKEVIPREDYTTMIDGTDFKVEEHPTLFLINLFGHLALTIGSLIFSVWEADIVGRQAVGHHRIMRSEGVESTKAVSARNFVYYYQTTTIQKHPNWVTPGNYFQLQLGGLRDALGVVLFFLVISIQFKVLKFRSDVRYTNGRLVVFDPDLTFQNYTCIGNECINVDIF